jgi:hypothetical protein
MQNYRFLNLPKNPLINTSAALQKLAIAATKVNSSRQTTSHRQLGDAPPLSGGAFHECFKNIEDFISPSVLDTFRSIGIKPSFFASFASDGVSSLKIEQRVAHYDLCFDEKNKKWATIPIGINWEITPGDTTFYWWNIASDPIFPNQENIPPSFKLLNGAHFDRRNQIGIPVGAEVIEKVQVTAPILVRTDVPHSVSFNSPAKTRYNISLRFSTDDIPTWDHALEVFKPLFL